MWSHQEWAPQSPDTDAYAGATPLIENVDLIPLALSIHSLEARHTSFLNVLNGKSAS